LLEAAVDGVAGEEGVRAQRLVGLLAEVAGEAGAVEPLDTGVVANLRSNISMRLDGGYEIT
jgi:hypothetical protein